MSELLDVNTSLNNLIGNYSLTRDELLTIISGPADGGPNNDGWYPVTKADGNTANMPSIAKMLSLTVNVRGLLLSTWTELNALAATSEIGAEYSVDVSDVGTHTEPAAGTVPNSGTYKLVAGTPNYFKRTGNLLTTDIIDAVNTIQALRDEILEDEGFMAVAADLESGGNIAAVAALADEITAIVANLEDIQAAADLVPLAPVTITAKRVLTATDDNRMLFVNMEGPGSLSLLEIEVPSNSANPLPIGTKFELMRTGGIGIVQFVSDSVGDAVITPIIPTENVLTQTGHRCFLLKTGTNSWSLYAACAAIGNLSADAYTVPVWLDPADLSTMRQERTGATATTPVAVGNFVGSWRNKGTFGGWATARADDRRPILRQDAMGRYYLEFDGTNDFLELLGLPLDLAKLNMFIGWQSLSYKNTGGIVALAPLGLSGGGGYNTAWTFYQNFSTYPVPADFAFAMGSSGPTKLQVGLQTVSPRRPRVIEWRSTSNADPKTITLDGKLIQSTGPGALAALAKVTALESATVRMVIGANNGDDGGQQGAIQFSHSAIYGIAARDTILSTVQRASIRTYIENASYPTPHVMPDISDSTELEAARDTLINEIFGGALPTDLATVATDSSPPPMGGLAPYISSVEKLTIPGESDPDIKPRVWNPTTPRTDVFAIFFPGHGAGIVENSGEIYGIRPLVEAGVTVASCYLPEGVNDYRAGGDVEHNTVRPPYVKWVRQCVVTINTLLNRFPGAKVMVFGISGGGWATQLCGAVDARIDSTVQFVGSLPADYYFGGDWEQLYTEISADYLTTYLLAAAGGSGGRRHLHVLHENDAVGFNRYTYDARPPFDEELADQAASLGGHYEMLWRDEAFHNLYPSSSAILLAELPTP